MFCIDLAWDERHIPTAQLEICEMDKRAIEDERQAYGGLDGDFDRRIFTNELAAEDFLAGYGRAIARVESGALCLDRALPGMAYRKRMLAMALMGIKMETSRAYDRQWAPGTLFNLHDRTNFVTVRLLGIERKNGTFIYRFELP